MGSGPTFGHELSILASYPRRRKFEQKNSPLHGGRRFCFTTCSGGEDGNRTRLNGFAGCQTDHATRFLIFHFSCQATVGAVAWARNMPFCMTSCSPCHCSSRGFLPAAKHTALARNGGLPQANWGAATWLIEFVAGRDHTDGIDCLWPYWDIAAVPVTALWHALPVDASDRVRLPLRRSMR